MTVPANAVALSPCTSSAHLSSTSSKQPSRARFAKEAPARMTSSTTTCLPGADVDEGVPLPGSLPMRKPSAGKRFDGPIKKPAAGFQLPASPLTTALLNVGDLSSSPTAQKRINMTMVLGRQEAELQKQKRGSSRSRRKERQELAARPEHLALRQHSGCKADESPSPPSSPDSQASTTRPSRASVGGSSSVSGSTTPDDRSTTTTVTYFSDGAGRCGRSRPAPPPILLLASELEKVKEREKDKENQQDNQQDKALLQKQALKKRAAQDSILLSEAQAMRSRSHSRRRAPVLAPGQAAPLDKTCSNAWAWSTSEKPAAW